MNPIKRIISPTCGCEIHYLPGKRVTQVLCDKHKIKCSCGCDDLSMLDLTYRGNETLVFCNQCGKSHVQAHSPVPEA